MSEELMNTKELSHYLDINEKQVYALIKANRIPATKITGKWIFPKKIIDEWLDKNARSGLEEARQKSDRMPGALLAAGSNDPVLDMLLTHLRSSSPDFYFFAANTGSTEGLKALNQGYTDIAWTHLYDPQTDTYNIPFISTYLPHMESVLVHLFKRALGLVVAAGNPLDIKSFRDLATNEVRFINRQPGSGTRVLLDHHLKQLNISPDRIAGYQDEVFTHFEVGLAVLSQQADTGLATASAAKLLGLAFIPITMENFDMALKKSTFFLKGVQDFIGALNAKSFRERVEKMGGYDFQKSGQVIYAAP